ncbi:MAG: ABC-type multidrug transport system, ATPase component [Pseudarthrobacter sp.]|nr:ABC-type multidrug transport system, ATPase component [Pseudarthrobacter sp.]
MNAAKKRVVEKFGQVGDFGRTRAPCGHDRSDAAGEVLDFLGPNGACKAATLSIRLGLTRSTAGTVWMVGEDRWADPVGVRGDIAGPRLTVVPDRAGSRHGSVR